MVNEASASDVRHDRLARSLVKARVQSPYLREKLASMEAAAPKHPYGGGTRQ